MKFRTQGLKNRGVVSGLQGGIGGKEARGGKKGSKWKSQVYILQKQGGLIDQTYPLHWGLQGVCVFFLSIYQGKK